MPYVNYTPEEVESRGEAIYAELIRPRVEARDKGKFVVIDIESGDYEIDEEDLRATQRVLHKRPKAVLYGLRVGYETAYSLGGHLLAEES